MKQKISFPRLALIAALLLVIISYCFPWIDNTVQRAVTFEQQCILLLFPVLPCLGFAAYVLWHKMQKIRFAIVAECCILLAAAVPVGYLAYFIHRAYYVLGRTPGYMQSALQPNLPQSIFALAASLVLLFVWHTLLFFHCKNQPLSLSHKAKTALKILRIISVLALVGLLIALLISCNANWFVLFSKHHPPLPGTQLRPILLFLSVFVALFLCWSLRVSPRSPLPGLFAGVAAAAMPVILLDRFIRLAWHRMISTQIKLNLSFEGVQPAFWTSLFLAILILFLLFVYLFLQAVSEQKPKQ